MPYQPESAATMDYDGEGEGDGALAKILLDTSKKPQSGKMRTRKRSQERFNPYRRQGKRRPSRSSAPLTPRDRIDTQEAYVGAVLDAVTWQGGRKKRTRKKHQKKNKHKTGKKQTRKYNKRINKRANKRINKRINKRSKTKTRKNKK